MIRRINNTKFWILLIAQFYTWINWRRDTDCILFGILSLSCCWWWLLFLPLWIWHKKCPTTWAVWLSKLLDLGFHPLKETLLMEVMSTLRSLHDEEIIIFWSLIRSLIWSYKFINTYSTSIMCVFFVWNIVKLFILDQSWLNMLKHSLLSSLLIP